MAPYKIEHLFPEGVMSGDEIAIHSLLCELNQTQMPSLLKRHVTYMAAETEVWVARLVSEGTIVGFGRLVKYPGHYGPAYQMGDIVVHPGHRRQRIATRIVQNLVETARKMKIAHIDLLSNDERVGAQHIYKAFGFVDRGLTRGFSLDL